MLRASIRTILKKYHIGIESEDTIGIESDEISRLVNDDNHKIMRKQITMNIFPFGNDGTDPALVIRAVIIFIE